MNIFVGIVVVWYVGMRWILYKREKSFMNMESEAVSWTCED